ncbi:MAG TPA: peptidase, partial [Cyclobacteriaceae bacterium]|nr:peptidase [Cyclobacteriaceae bacterium]HNU41800.1 peptidase [Cyclobacteriaceae bacterium]
MKYFLLFVTLFSSICGWSQRKKETSQTPEPVVKSATSPIEAKIAGLKKYPGFLEFYYDEKQDKVLILIDKLNTELLYIESLTAGVGSNDLGLDR